MAELRNEHADRFDPDKAYRIAGLGSPFSRGISHGDIDSAIEANGHHLFIEFKHTGESMSIGQILSLAGLVRKGDTVFIVYGEPHAGEQECMTVTEIAIMKRTKGFSDPLSYSMAADLSTLHVFEHAWFYLAERAAPPEPRAGVFEPRE